MTGFLSFAKTTDVRP